MRTKRKVSQPFTIRFSDDLRYPYRAIFVWSSDGARATLVISERANRSTIKQAVFFGAACYLKKMSATLYATGEVKLIEG